MNNMARAFTIILVSCLISSDVLGADPLCLVGNPKSKTLIEQYTKDSRNNDFLKLFKQNKTTEFCPAETTMTEVTQMTQLRDELLLRGAPPKIKLDCIRSSMSRIPNIPFSSKSGKRPLTRRAVCSSDSELPKWQSYEPCLNDEVVRLVQWSVNNALECGNALALKIGGLPIDPKIFFQKINNESAFGFHLQNSGGIGIGQLTSIAVKEVSKPSKSPLPGPPMKNYVQAAMEEPACNSFKSVLDEDIQFTGSNKKTVRHCQFLSGGNGMARNLFYSIMLFIHNRSVIGIKKGQLAGGVQQIASSYGITDTAKIDYLTLVSYGRGGMARVSAIISTLAKNRALSNVDINKVPIEEFLGHLDKLSPYINETRNKMDEFLKIHNAEITPENQTGAICVE